MILLVMWEIFFISGFSLEMTNDARAGKTSLKALSSKVVWWSRGVKQPQKRELSIQAPTVSRVGCIVPHKVLYFLSKNQLIGSIPEQSEGDKSNKKVKLLW